MTMIEVCNRVFLSFFLIYIVTSITSVCPLTPSTPPTSANTIKRGIVTVDKLTEERDSTFYVYARRYGTGKFYIFQGNSMS